MMTAAERKAKHRERAIAQGLCQRCCAKKARPNRALCRKCAKTTAEQQKGRAA